MKHGEVEPWLNLPMLHGSIRFRFRDIGFNVGAHFGQAIAAEFLGPGFGQGDGEHGFANDTASGHDANIAALVAAFGDVFTAADVDGGQRMGQRGDGLDANAHDDWFTVADAALEATSVVAQALPFSVISVANDIVDLRTKLGGAKKAAADLDAFS